MTSYSAIHKVFILLAYSFLKMRGREQIKLLTGCKLLTGVFFEKKETYFLFPFLWRNRLNLKTSFESFLFSTLDHFLFLFFSNFPPTTLPYKKKCSKVISHVKKRPEAQKYPEIIFRMFRSFQTYPEISTKKWETAQDGIFELHMIHFSSILLTYFYIHCL